MLDQWFGQIGTFLTSMNLHRRCEVVKKVAILFVKFTFIPSTTNFYYLLQLIEKKTSRHVSSKLYGFKLERSPMLYQYHRDLSIHTIFKVWTFKWSGPYSSFHRILQYLYGQNVFIQRIQENRVMFNKLSEIKLVLIWLGLISIMVDD